MCYVHLQIVVLLSWKPLKLLLLVLNMVATTKICKYKSNVIIMKWKVISSTSSQSTSASEPWFLPDLGVSHLFTVYLVTHFLVYGYLEHCLTDCAEIDHFRSVYKCVSLLPSIVRFFIWLHCLRDCHKVVVNHGNSSLRTWHYKKQVTVCPSRRVKIINVTKMWVKNICWSKGTR